MLYDDGRYSGVCIPAARCQSHVWVLVWVNIVTRLILLSCLTSPTVSCCSWMGCAWWQTHFTCAHNIIFVHYSPVLLGISNIESDWIAEIRSFCIEWLWSLWSLSLQWLSSQSLGIRSLLCDASCFVSQYWLLRHRGDDLLPQHCVPLSHLSFLHAFIIYSLITWINGMCKC